MKGSRIIIAFAVLLAATQPSFAKWIGKGEVTGEVIRSRSVDNNVVFDLTISSQRIEQGPKLGNPNTFGFDGSDRMEITPGDIVKLRVNSSDDYGIRVEQFEFVENKPGTPERMYSPSGQILLLFTLIVVAAIVLLLMKRKRAI